MPISLSNFVGVNFDASRKTVLASSYPTSVLISKEASKGTKTYEDFASFAADYTTSSQEIYKAGKTYFDNGGISLKVVKREQEETIEQTLSKIIMEKFIMFACSDTIIDNEVVAVGKYLSTLKAPEKKIFVVTDTNANAKNYESEDSLSSKINSFDNIVLKYSSTNKQAGMATMAYFSQINLDGNDTVEDYMFTQETLSVEDVTELEADTLQSRNYNFYTSVGLNTRFNVGGNTANGIAIEERWALIAIENDIVDVLIKFLQDKPKMEESTTTAIQNNVNGILNRYLQNGLLAPNAVYTGEDIIERYNNKSYKLLNKNSILENGYEVYVLPISSLTPQDRAKHKAPNVYAYLAVASGIREISVEGAVI